MSRASWQLLVGFAGMFLAGWQFMSRQPAWGAVTMALSIAALAAGARGMHNIR